MYAAKYVTRKYGHAIIVFDGYQEGLSMKDNPHERRTCGRAGPTVDFTRDMVMNSKKEDLHFLIQQGQQPAIH